jgi:hypothetical protein
MVTNVEELAMAYHQGLVDLSLDTLAVTAVADGLVTRNDINLDATSLSSQIGPLPHIGAPT